MQLIITFIVLSIINVIFSTIRSITTIKSGKGIASLISAGYFSFYNIMIIYTVIDFPLWQKCLITFCCNLIGVYVVKLGEEKARKEKLWKIEMAIKSEYCECLSEDLSVMGIPHNCNITNDKRWTTFNCYCSTQQQSAIVNGLCEKYGAKYFITETKNF